MRQPACSSRWTWALSIAAPADGIDHQIDMHAAARRVLERPGEGVAHLARLIDVGFEADAPRGAADGCLHRRKDLIAVGEDREAVAVGQLSAEQPGHVGGMTGLGGADCAAELQRDLVLGHEQEHGDHPDGRDGGGDHVSEARQAHTAPLKQLSGRMAFKPGHGLRAHAAPGRGLSCYCTVAGPGQPLSSGFAGSAVICSSAQW